LVQIGEHYDTKPANIYKHVNALIDAGWVKCVGERSLGGGSPTKFYIAVKRVSIETRRGRLPIIPIDVCERLADKQVEEIVVPKKPGKRGRLRKQKEVDITDYIPDKPVKDEPKPVEKVEKKLVDFVFNSQLESSLFRYILFNDGVTYTDVVKYSQRKSVVYVLDRLIEMGAIKLERAVPKRHRKAKEMYFSVYTSKEIGKIGVR